MSLDPSSLLRKSSGAASSFLSVDIFCSPSGGRGPHCPLLLPQKNGSKERPISQPVIMTLLNPYHPLHRPPTSLQRHHQRGSRTQQPDPEDQGADRATSDLDEREEREEGGYTVIHRHSAPVSGQETWRSRTSPVQALCVQQRWVPLPSPHDSRSVCLLRLPCKGVGGGCRAVYSSTSV